MGDWRTASNSVPDFLINSTIQEKGKRIVFSSNGKFTNDVDVKSHENSAKYSFSTSDAEIRTTTCTEDLPVVRAARYSATFPYVTPATKLEIDGTCNNSSIQKVHFIDGGYVDNSGIQTLLDYIKFHDDTNNQELSRPDNPRQIIIIHIDAYQHAVASESKRHPLIHELTSPISGILNTRKAQGHSNRLDLERLKSEHGLLINPVVYLGYDGTTLPLSWHLSKKEINDIEVSANSIRKPYIFKNKISSICEKLKKDESANKHFACLKNFWDQSTIVYGPSVPPVLLPSSIEKMIGDIPSKTVKLLETTSGKFITSLWKEFEVLSSNKEIGKTLTSNEKNTGEIVKSLDALSENILAIKNSQSEVSSLTSEPLWIERARSLVCSENTTPKLIATSPPFYSGLPATNGSWRSIEKMASCGDSLCSISKIVDKAFLSSKAISQGVTEQTFVVGMASALDSPKNNFDLAERRANWLLSILEEKFNFDDIRSLSWGEMIPFEHPRIQEFGELNEASQASQFAFAFQCTPSSLSLDITSQSVINNMSSAN